MILGWAMDLAQTLHEDAVNASQKVPHVTMVIGQTPSRVNMVKRLRSCFGKNPHWWQ